MHIALNELFGFVSHPVCVCPFQMDMSMPAVLEHVISPFDLSVLEYNTACIYISTLPRPRLNVWQSAKRKAQQHCPPAQMVMQTGKLLCDPRLPMQELHCIQPYPKARAASTPEARSDKNERKLNNETPISTRTIPLSNRVELIRLAHHPGFPQLSLLPWI
jgi:hypothetical protein